MSFRGQPFAFDSPAAAVEAMTARLAEARAQRTIQTCDLAAAAGRILAQAVTADRDSPAFDHSAMDGYAARAADLAAPPGELTLPVRGESRIGQPPAPMPAGPCVVRITTGAGIPPGADTVIKRELVQEKSAVGAAAAVEVITIAPAQRAAIRAGGGEHIRRRGENARAGATLIEPGTVISAATIGTLAAVGCVTPSVYAPLRVAVITTGDELVPPAQQPEPFQLRNSNASAVAGVVNAHRWMTVVSNEHTDDDGDRLADLLHAAAAHADAVVLTGGISMGHRDPVRAAIDELKAQVLFHGLPQRPGKPMLGAVTAAGKPVFALPGNPVSAMVTCTRIVVPVLAAQAGVARWPAALRVPLANPDGKSIDLWWHRLVRVTDRGEVELVDGQGSGDLVAGGRSDGFVEVPPSGHPAPAQCAFYPWPI